MVDYSPTAVRARLRLASEQTSLRQDSRLTYKVDYSPAAVRARLAEVEALRRACAVLGAVGAPD